MSILRTQKVDELVKVDDGVIRSSRVSIQILPNLSDLSAEFLAELSRLLRRKESPV